MSESGLQQIRFRLHPRIAFQARAQGSARRYDTLGCALRIRILSERREIRHHAMHRSSESD